MNTWIWRLVWLIGALVCIASRPGGIVSLAILLFQRNRWEDAAQEYRKALGIEPRQSGLHTLLGEAYLHAGKLEQSETEFRLDLQLDSRNELAWLGLANLQLAKGQASEALASVGKVWQISPEFLKLRPELPSIELTKEAAQASISRLLDQPEGPAKHFLLAGLYASMNENALSEREWKSFQMRFLEVATSVSRYSASPCQSGSLQSPSLFSMYSLAANGKAFDRLGSAPRRKNVLYIATIRTRGWRVSASAWRQPT